MLKVLRGSGLKGALWRRVQSAAAPVQHYLPSGPHEKTREGEAMPMPPEHQWNPRSQYSTRRKKDKNKGEGWHFPTTVREKRIAVEVMETISEALQQGSCYSPVLTRCGFQIVKDGCLSSLSAFRLYFRSSTTWGFIDSKVKMSSDLRVAHVLWTALPGMQRTAEKAAISKVQHLRSLVFKRLNLPFSPTLRFQEDKPSQEMLALEEAFAKLKEEEGEDQRLKESESEDQKPKESESEDQNQDPARLGKEKSSSIAPS